MDKIRFITNLIGISLCLVSSITTVSFANTKVNEYTMESAYGDVSDKVVAQRVNEINTEVDFRYTHEVRRNILKYTSKYRRSSEYLLGKVEIYFPLFEEEIRKRNLPDELKYLAIIESNLKPDARSPVGATGLWQFMLPTARMYNLTINHTIDERRDPAKSTEAALNYLSDLYNQFKDWTLAMAAYNCGPGNVLKAIKKADSWDYWKIRPYLPKETREYIPRFIAVNYLFNYYTAHSLTPRKASADLVYTASTPVYDKLRFTDVTNITGLNFEVVKKLNPAYLKHYIPENSDGFTLTLPRQDMSKYLADRIERMKVEELEKINNKVLEKMGLPRSNFPEKIVSKTNPPNPLPIVMAAVAVLDNPNPSPVSNGSSKLPVTSREAKEIKKNSKTRYEYYKLGDSETLQDFANKREDVMLETLYKLNHYSVNNLPKSGTIIKVKKL